MEQIPENPAALFGYVDVVIRHTAIDAIRQHAGRQFRTQFPTTEIPEDLRDLDPAGLSDGVLQPALFRGDDRIALHRRSAID